MSRIYIDPEPIMNRLRQIQNAAEPMSSLHCPGEYSGTSLVLSEILSVCESLCGAASAYYRSIQCVVERTASLLESLIAEDVQIGEEMGCGN